MGWLIKCTDPSCQKTSWAANIVDLIQNHVDSNGWFLCKCGKFGCIEKSYKLQEEGKTWEPFLKGIISLGDPKETYQPFVFLVSDKCDGEINDVWFSYYKDLRKFGGSLKFGYGPGGSPVLGKESLKELLTKLRAIKYLSQKDFEDILKKKCK